jgi:FMN-dependent NADH-azoreductase
MDARPTTHLLHIDSSARSATSLSRELGRNLVMAWSQRDPGAVLTYRDLDADPVPYVDEAWVTAAFTPADRRDADQELTLSRSNALIAELEAADVLVIGAPMYNFGIPAALKAWIDQVVRIGRTFGYDGPRAVGLLEGKRAVIVATAGGDADGYEGPELDFRTSYLRAILGFIGITDVEVIAVVGTLRSMDVTDARLQIADLLDRQVGALGAIPQPV